MKQPPRTSAALESPVTARPAPTSASASRRWSPASIAGIFAAWLVLQIGGLFTPGLLDDVDSIYIQIAREMLQRHDFVTPTIDGIRFFDKPPLMYWMAAGSMRVFGIHAWAARLPLALGMLALLIAVYALGIRLFSNPSALSEQELTGAPCGQPMTGTPCGQPMTDAPSGQPMTGAPSSRPTLGARVGTTDRGGLYAALILATSVGPYLYTRFYIPDILIALWLTLAIHCFLIALDRITTNRGGPSVPLHGTGGKALLPMLGFAAATALSVLTKGLIGAVFPIGFALLYLAFTRQLKVLSRLHLPAATAVFFVIAAPWHVLAAIRNPAIAMPPGMGLPAKAGWAWFYLYNEHVARFLSKRIPHDYGQTPVWQFWLLTILWMMPWATFLPAALKLFLPRLQRNATTSPTDRQPAVTLTLWIALVLGFFTLSARQEYYSLPALPALALLLGGTLAFADTQSSARANTIIRRWSLWLLVPLTTTIALVCGYFALTAPSPAAGVALDKLLSSNPQMYNLSLGHVYDLTGEAMGFFRGPLITVCLSMLALGLGSHLLRRRDRTVAANIITAAAMCGVLLAAHEGLVRFYPILGSKDLADTIKADGLKSPVLIDGELTTASSVLFYLDNPVLLVNGRVNGPWFGSFWPDARPIFLDDADLLREWHTRTSLYLLTYHPELRIPALCKVGPVRLLSSSGGEAVLRNTAPTPTDPAHIPGTDACSR